MAFDYGLNALTGNRLEVLRSGECDIALFCTADDCRSEWVFACLLETCGEPKELRLILARKSSDRHELRLAFGEGTGFIDDKGVNLFKHLKRLSVFHEHSSLSSAAGPDHD